MMTAIPTTDTKLVSQRALHHTEKMISLIQPSEMVKSTAGSIQNHGITNAEKDLQDRPVQLSIYHRYFRTESCLLVHLNGS